MREDVLQFLDWVFREGRGVKDFYTTTVGFVSAPLAPLYGVTGNFAADTSTKVDLDPNQRSGLLTQPGFLSSYIHGEDQASYEQRIKLNMRLMAFSAAADYSRVAVLKIGDRIDDHVFTMNGQSFKFHDASHRAVNNALDLHHACDRLFAGYFKYLLDLLSSYDTPTGPLLDQGVAIWTNQCATGAHSFSNVPWILAGSANGFFRQGQFVQVGSGQMPSGTQDGKGGDASVSGVNKLLNTLLTAAGVTKTGAAPTDDLGEASLPKGIFSELLA